MPESYKNIPVMLNFDWTKVVGRANAKYEDGAWKIDATITDEFAAQLFDKDSIRARSTLYGISFGYAYKADRPRSDPHEATLSKMLWEARERLEMFSDMVEIQSRKTDVAGRKLIEQIDRFRDTRGWPADGFGGE